MNSEGVGEMEFDPQISGWRLLSSSYYCKESNIKLFQLLQMKKAFRELQKRVTIDEIPNKNI